MAMKFDATLKGLSRAFPRDILITFDPAASGPVEVFNVDLSTMTAAADLVVGLGEPLAEIVHIDFQSSANAKKHLDILAYNTLLYRTYEVPVHSIIVLLRRSAGHTNVKGPCATPLGRDVVQWILVTRSFPCGIGPSKNC